MKKLFSAIREKLKAKKAPRNYHEVSADGRSEIFYLDDDNNYANKGEHTRTIINEKDDQGNVVREVFGINGDPTDLVQFDYDDLTEEEKKCFAESVDKDGNHLWPEIADLWNKRDGKKEPYAVYVEKDGTHPWPPEE